MNKMYKRLKGIIRSVDIDNYTVDAVISSSAVDRYNEVINIDAWKDGLSEYMKHPVLLTSHDYSELTNQIGIALSISIVGNDLIAKFKYFVGEGNPEADWAFNLASKGQAAYSVGFESLASETPSEPIDGADVERIYTKVNLLEVSQVLIPANPEALQKMKQLIGDFEDEQIKTGQPQGIAPTEEKKKTDKTHEDRIKELEDCIKDHEDRIKDLEDGNEKSLKKTLFELIEVNREDLTIFDKRIKQLELANKQADNHHSELAVKFKNELSALNARLI
ncbi:MAG: HK97 family phage prohead protease [Nitrospirae bacterium]|nr:HK97 family phage prohead protease [Nitrospirota bacterium]